MPSVSTSITTSSKNKLSALESDDNDVCGPGCSVNGIVGGARPD